MRSITLRLGIVLIFIGLLVTIPPAHSKDKIRIGFSMALTGIYSQGATSQINAYKLWEEIVNEQGGIFVRDMGKKLPVEFVYYDDKSSPETAVKVYEKLITQDKVDLVFTPWGTTIHFAIASLAEKYRYPMVGTTAASVKLRDIKSRYFWFVTSCIPDRQMQALVDLLSFLNINTVAIIYVQDLFPRENLQFLRPALKRAGIKTVLLKDYPIGAKDLTVLLSDVKAKNPDALIALSYPADSFLLTGQVQGVMVNPGFLFELVGPSIAAFGKVFGTAAEGIATMGHWSPKAPWPGAREFEARYINRWKTRPDYLDSIEAFVGCQIVQQAIEKAGTLDREKIRDVIANSEFTTIAGPIKFTCTENRLTPSMILQYQKGDLEIIWPREVATAKPLFPKPPWPKKK
ncbi:MAG: amino acid ABC transporter substrate-binding protein [Deltaproteobacteria bacterium]|nr:amino acid ABC transporter substrate-binding protein [Deltaproteobacteria bacterium]